MRVMIVADLATVGPPEYMADESKELTLRVHDECMSPSRDLPQLDLVLSIWQVMDLMSLDPTFVPASPISSSPLKSVFVALNAVVLASSFTSARRVELLEKSPSRSLIHGATLI